MAVVNSANGQMRQHLDKALLLAHAFGYNPPPSEPELLREESFLQRLMHNVVPFIMFFVKAFAAIFGIFLLSIMSYWFLYSALMMRGLEVQSHPIFFDYSVGGPAVPVARVDLMSSSDGPWLYSCGNYNSNSHPQSSFCVQDDSTWQQKSPVTSDDAASNEDELEKVSRNTVLKSGQRYFADVVLKLPDSGVNKKLGMFMLTVELRSSDGSLLATSKQSSLFPYESELVRLTRKLILLLPLISGVIDETKTMSLLCFDNYMDSDKALSYVDISLAIPHMTSHSKTMQAIQILSAEFQYGKVMSPLQRIIRRWSYLFAFVGVFIIFISYALLALNLASRRGWLMNRHAYYPGFDVFGSDTNSTYNFEAGSQNNSWAGPEVEILDEADDENWEPLDSTGNAKHSTIIPDDESILPDSNDSSPNFDTEPASATFPLGSISQNPNVQSHPTLFSSRGNMQSHTNSETESSKEEEKRLADMVMNGQSKFEVFTDHDDPDDDILPPVEEDM